MIRCNLEKYGIFENISIQSVHTVEVFTTSKFIDINVKFT